MSGQRRKDVAGAVTPKQLTILTLIRDYQRKYGYSPTMQELADHLRVSKVTVFEHVDALVGKGLLRRVAHRARSLQLRGEVVLPDERAGGWPLVGRIAAGVPIEAVENIEAIDVHELFAAPGETFMLRVRGDSMVDEHICDGDYVVVEKRDTARNGETVVALLADGEATLKKFFRERGRVRLQPANEAFEPIFVEPSALRIQGVVIGVVRRV